MSVTFDIIYGLALGMEYVSACPEVDVPYPCFIVDVACFRWVIEMDGSK
jgi:hypothetical protein